MIYLIGSLRCVCKKTLNQTDAPQFLASLKGNRPSLHTVNKFSKLMKRFTFPGSNRCNQCFESGWYAIPVCFLLFFFFRVVTKILIFLSRFFLWFLLVCFSYVGLFCIFLFQFFFTPLRLSWDRKHQTTTGTVYILMWPFILLFRLFQALGAVNPFYRSFFFCLFSVRRKEFD